MLPRAATTLPGRGGAPVRGPEVVPSHGARPVEASVEWQHLWFAVVRKPWTSLVVVPAHAEISSARAALGLLTAGQAYSATPVHGVDATALDTQSVHEVISAIEWHVREGGRCIVAVDSPIKSPAAIAVARAASAALLVVPLEAAQVRASRRTVSLIGREHFIGAVTTRRRGV